MFKRSATVLLLVSSFLLPGLALKAAAQQPEKVDFEAVNKIKEQGLKNSKVMEYLSYMTDVYGPRLTGSPQLKAAQDWAEKTFTEIGLQHSHLESWGPFGRGWSLEGFSASMTKPTYAPLIAYPKAWSGSTKGTVRGAVVYLDAKTDADLEKYKGELKGAIVLITPAREVKAHFTPEGTRLTDEELLRLANAEPPAVGGTGRPEMSEEQRKRFEQMRTEQAFNQKKILFCSQEGATVIVESGRGDGGTIFVQSATLPYPQEVPFDQRKTFRDKDAPAILPQVVVAVEQYNRMVRALEKGVPVQMEVNVAARYQDQDLMNYNVIAEIPGSDLKDEIVMLGGHYDSWHSGTGATDNAAGSAVAMEAMRILMASGFKPRRTIRVALWSGEEQGLFGSRAYVAQHFGKRTDAGGNQFGPPQPGAPQTTPTYEFLPDYDKFSAYFNLDNGTGKIRGVYMQGNEAVRPIFRAWLAPFKDMGASTLSLANTGGTDHLAFDSVGLPGFQFIQDGIEYDTRTHHSNMDVYDRIQEEDMKQAAVIMASFVYHAAMRDQKLPRKAKPGQSMTVRAGQQ
ncbi:MAG: M20/M25/M40 family metallo-hydrolase [Acidobacteria bacterium]|nr:M20/M25/M40 family metallo-hydrolase [Acidobacteriota bacterium]